jgi:hypothetical protein
VIGALALLACSDKPNVPPTAQFNLYIQDGMADYDSIFVTVDSLYLIEDTDFEPVAKHQILAESDTFNIAYYRNGRFYPLIEEELSPVVVEGVEMIFSQGRIVVNGQAHPLIPGYYADTVHTSAEAFFSVSRGRLNEITVDINLFESISYELQSGYYLFNPVIRIIDNDSSGAIVGRTLPIANIYLFANSASDTLTYTVSEGDSLFFGFYGLEPGSYDMMCAPRGSDTLVYDTLVNYNIPVVPGGEYDMLLLDLPLL